MESLMCRPTQNSDHGARWDPASTNPWYASVVLTRLADVWVIRYVKGRGVGEEVRTTCSIAWVRGFDQMDGTGPNTIVGPDCCDRRDCEGGGEGWRRRARGFGIPINNPSEVEADAGTGMGAEG